VQHEKEEANQKTEQANKQSGPGARNITSGADHRRDFPPTPSSLKTKETRRSAANRRSPCNAWNLTKRFSFGSVASQSTEAITSIKQQQYGT
jgi:hypothetical protein